MRLKVYVNLMSWAFAHRVQLKVKGQGQAGGQKGSKLTSRLTHQWAGLSHSAQRTRQSQSLIYHASITVGPRDAACYFSAASLPPNQRQIRASLHDKVLWKTRQRKERGSFQLPWGANPLPTRGYGHMVLI